MNFLKMDGPLMNFLRTVVNYIFLQILFFICCIPVLTIGASIAAKYSVAMKLVKGEEDGIAKPFFKAFVKNLKTAVPVWCLMLVFFFLIYLDWVWMIDNGIGGMPIPLTIAFVIITIFLITVCLILFPMMARFKIKFIDAIKGTIRLAFLNLIKFGAIVLILFATIFVSIWYIQWAPLIWIVGFMAVTCFTALSLNKEFDKVEKQYREEHPEEFADEEDGELDFSEDTYEYQSALEGESYAAARVEASKFAKEMSKEERKEEDEKLKNMNKFQRYIYEEKQKLSTMTSAKQKFQYFCEYYLVYVILIILLGGAIGWYVSDVIKESNYVISGGLAGAAITEEGKQYVTEDFVSWGGYKSSKKGRIVNVASASSETAEATLTDISVFAAVKSGTYDYFIMSKYALGLYTDEDIFYDISEFYDASSIPEELRVYNSNKELVAIELDLEHKEKLGLPKNGKYYVGFLFNSDATLDAKFLDYLYQ